MSNTTLGFSLTSLIAITKPIFLLIRKCPIVGIYYVYQTVLIQLQNPVL